MEATENGLSLTWFESGEHPADDAQDERRAKRTERAQRVAQLTPLQAQARLLGDNRAPADTMPTVEVSLVSFSFSVSKLLAL